MEFSNCKLSINGYRILADSLSVNQSVSVSPLSVINFSSPLDYEPKNLEGSVSVDYYVETRNEPNYAIVSGWKSNTTGNTLSIIRVGSAIISGYLNNYSLSINPNEPVRAKATYSVFNNITGNMEDEISSASQSLYNLTNGSGIAHYWSTVLCNSSSDATGNGIIDMSYNISFDISPTYGLGNHAPKQVSSLSATEEISFTSQFQTNLYYTGNSKNMLFTTHDIIKLKDLSSLWQQGNSYEMLFPMDGMKIVSNNASLSVNNIILYTTKLTKSY